MREELGKIIVELAGENPDLVEIVARLQKIEKRLYKFEVSINNQLVNMYEQIEEELGEVKRIV